MAVTAPPSITALPTPPDPDDRATFNSRAYPWSVAQQTLATEIGAVATNVYNNAVDAAASASSASSSASTATTQAGLATTNGAAQVALATAQAVAAAASASSAANAPGTSATSATSLTIGLGSKSLVIQTGKAYSVGQFLIVAYTTTPANYMQGQITSHNSSTGDLTLNVTSIGGSGTYAAWTVSMNTAAAQAQAAVVPAATTIYTAMNFGGF